MPDILICGMDMPEGCLSCNLRATSGLDEWMCMVNRMRFPSWEDGWNGDKYRHVDCPLVELPAHGDLKDANKLLAEFERDERAADEHGREFSFSFDSGGARCTEWWIVQQKLMDAPVIVPASEEATNDPKP